MLEAKAQGRTRYFTGKACPRGHIVERMVSTRGCVGCIAEKAKAARIADLPKAAAKKRAYRNANLEKVRAWNLANQKKNRAAANARNRKYAETHREELALKNALWAKNNPGKNTAKSARRRAAELRATPIWADQARITRAYELAASIRVEHGIDCHVDHIIPLQGRNVCGLHVHDNLQIISSKANRAKSNKF